MFPYLAYSLSSLLVSLSLFTSSFNLASLSLASLNYFLSSSNYSESVMPSPPIIFAEVASLTLPCLDDSLLNFTYPMSLFVFPASLRNLSSASSSFSFAALSFITISIASWCFYRQNDSLSLNFLFTDSTSYSSYFTCSMCWRVILEKYSSFSFASS